LEKGEKGVPDMIERKEKAENVMLDTSIRPSALLSQY
jgi:hypothetical protein